MQLCIKIMVWFNTACTAGVRLLSLHVELVPSLHIGESLWTKCSAQWADMWPPHTFCRLLGGCCSLAMLLNMYLICGM